MSPASQAAAAQKPATSQGERPPQPKANEKAKGFTGLGGHLVK
jgi:hypothetical protein